MSTAHSLWSPWSGLRLRMQRWWHARLRPSDQHRLHQHNVYILPTRAGWMLGITLLAMLVAAINYQLNLGYLLTFVLVGNGVAGVYLCHGTLRGLDMRLHTGPRVFSGQAQSLFITLVNPQHRSRWAIALNTLQAASGDVNDWPMTDVPPQGQATVELRWPTAARGWQDLPLLSAETRYPMGMFRVWTLWRPASRVLVYPKPENHPPPWPLHSLGADEGDDGVPQSAGEYDSVRPYHHGDTQRTLVWLKVARSDNPEHWVSREQAQATRAPLWFDWQATAGLDTETRLSRLTAWVLKAERSDLVYGLRLPGRALPPASGLMHRDACLEALALC
jgi:uncharacterized protein (DUF58 family)